MTQWKKETMLQKVYIAICCSDYIQYMDGFPFYPQKFFKTNDISKSNILLHSYEYFCLISSLEIFDNAVLPPYCNYH